MCCSSFLLIIACVAVSFLLKIGNCMCCSFFSFDNCMCCSFFSFKKLVIACVVSSFLFVFSLFLAKEFFLQTLVKRKFVSQANMIFLQRVLMFFASVAAAKVVLLHVMLHLALLSMLLNFANRGHDVLNCAIVVGVAFLLA